MSVWCWSFVFSPCSFLQHNISHLILAVCSISHWTGCSHTCSTGSVTKRMKNHEHSSERCLYSYNVMTDGVSTLSPWSLLVVWHTENKSTALSSHWDGHLNVIVMLLPRTNQIRHVLVRVFKIFKIFLFCRLCWENVSRGPACEHNIFILFLLLTQGFSDFHSSCLFLSRECWSGFCLYRWCLIVVVSWELLIYISFLEVLF